MEDVNVMECLQAFHYLDQNAPDVFLSQICLLSLVPCNLLEEISIIGVLHNNAKGAGWLIDEGLVITTNVVVLD